MKLVAIELDTGIENVRMEFIEPAGCFRIQRFRAEYTTPPAFIQWSKFPEFVKQEFPKEWSQILSVFSLLGE